MSTSSHRRAVKKNRESQLKAAKALAKKSASQLKPVAQAAATLQPSIPTPAPVQPSATLTNASPVKKPFTLKSAVKIAGVLSVATNIFLGIHTYLDQKRLRRFEYNETANAMRKELLVKISTADAEAASQMQTSMPRWRDVDEDTDYDGLTGPSSAIWGIEDDWEKRIKELKVEYRNRLINCEEIAGGPLEAVQEAFEAIPKAVSPVEMIDNRLKSMGDEDQKMSDAVDRYLNGEIRDGDYELLGFPFFSERMNERSDVYGEMHSAEGPDDEDLRATQTQDLDEIERINAAREELANAIKSRKELDKVWTYPPSH